MQNLPTSSTQWPVSVGGHTTREGIGLQSAALVLAYSCALNKKNRHEEGPAKFTYTEPQNNNCYKNEDQNDIKNKTKLGRTEFETIKPHFACQVN